MMRDQMLAPGKFKFAWDKQENAQTSICLVKYSKDGIHFCNIPRLLQNIFTRLLIP